MSESINIFQQATRKKLRFESSKGLLSVEDLWDLPLVSPRSAQPSLDEVAKGLYIKMKNSDENISFVTTRTNADTVTQLSFDVVKYIIDVKKSESDAAEIKKANKDKKEQILSLIAQKENEKLLTTDLDKLKEMAASIPD